MDLDFNMTFPMGSTFVFGSWVYTVDDPDKLQSRLVEITANQATLVNHQDELEDLIETISKFYIFYPTRTRKQLKEFESYSNTTSLTPTWAQEHRFCLPDLGGGSGDPSDRRSARLGPLRHVRRKDCTLARSPATWELI
jgi:hypothetical protein